MKTTFCTILFLLLLSNNTTANTLKPFISDSCSYFLNGTFEKSKLWLPCCRKHDFDYWKGGTYQKRIVSDIELKNCVSEVGQPELPALMLAGVRLLVLPYYQQVLGGDMVGLTFDFTVN